MSSKNGKPHPIGIGMVPCTTELGRFIRACRLKLGIRQIPLAEKAGMKQTFVSGLETGTRKYLDDAELLRLADALQCDPEELRKRGATKKVSQPTTDLGKILRARREELGMTLETFAENMKIKIEHATDWELRKSRGLNYNSMQSLARVLQLDPSVLSPFIGTSERPTKSALGQLIRKRRKELGMSINLLAKTLDVSSQMVSYIERGRVSLSNSDGIIQRIANALTLDVNDLLTVRQKRKLKAVYSDDPLASFLATRRVELNLVQREVSDRSGINITTVCGIEKGRIRPNSTHLEKLSAVLGCEIPPELLT